MPKELINDDGKAFATLVLTNFFYKLHFDKKFAEIISEMIATIDDECRDNEVAWRLCFGMATSAFVTHEASVLNKENAERESK